MHSAFIHTDKNYKLVENIWICIETICPEGEFVFPLALFVMNGRGAGPLH